MVILDLIDIKDFRMDQVISRMAPLTMATIQPSTTESQQHNAVKTPCSNEKASPHENGEQNPDETKSPSTHLPYQGHNQASAASDPEWKAGRDEWMVIIVLAIVSLMVALDATILVPVLPVSGLKHDIKRI